ncbi:hypothetical protein D9619_009818 [Psilocybe cf. subviscida]|uniref:DUF6535 domain-containing protein n=1 Tax=Psilocybe cf. subviscida TaxID=2480587 RepID=A0A8H5F5Z8_9AGAR|nr:hypothetical protein D9619_009818 [Psilocybe cf. subviscida]
MSSEPSLASVENASTGEGEATRAQGGKLGNDPTPQAAQLNINVRNHDIDIIEQQRVAERNSVHSLPEGNSGSDSSLASLESVDDIPIPELPKPKAIPKPDYDPFERLLKPMLEQDNIQCNAWKDEVQNLLIFAGLFSAVVTAFIIESYQRLQPDPNDAIVSLLAHIAEKLDNPSVNATVSVASIVSDTNFSPSRSNININIFWFVSLVLSLTVALIGVVALQWLREHQHYDSSLKPHETVAILHMRLDGLEDWYVPQIFAGLPLLLQGALVYAVQDPFRLSIINTVLSPCPYKSPQSLIVRRIGVHSATVVKFIAAIFAGAYACHVQITILVRKLHSATLVKLTRAIFAGAYACCVQIIILVRKLRSATVVKSIAAIFADTYAYVVRITILVRKLAGRSSSVFEPHQPDLQVLLWHRGFHDISLADNSAQWTSIDVSWMRSRTDYVTLARVVNSGPVTVPYAFQLASRDIMSPEVYDCTHCLRMILVEGGVKADHHAIYHCIACLSSQLMDNLHNSNKDSFSDWVRSAESDFAFVLGQIFCDIYVVDWNFSVNTIDMAAFLKDAIFHKSPNGSQITVEALCAASMLSFWVLKSSFPLASEPTIQTIADDTASAFTISRLSISPHRLFAMSSGDMWFPRFLRHFSYVSGTLMPIILQFPITDIKFHVAESHSPFVPHLLRIFFERCSTMQLNSRLLLHPSPASENYGGLKAYMEYIVRHQQLEQEHVQDGTVAHLKKLCSANTTTSPLIQEKPFLVIAVCIYLGATNKFKYYSPSTRAEYRSLAGIILDACGLGSDRTLSVDKVINTIYHHHNPSTQSTNTPGNSPSPVGSNGSDDSV